MTSLSEIPIRAQTLWGQIKQADSDVLESERSVERAAAVLQREQDTLANARARGADLRRQLEELAHLAHGQILGEEVIQSSPSGGVIDDGALVSGQECNHAEGPTVIERAPIPGEPDNVRRCASCGVLVELSPEQMRHLLEPA